MTPLIELEDGRGHVFRAPLEEARKCVERYEARKESALTASALPAVDPRSREGGGHSLDASLPVPLVSTGSVLRDDTGEGFSSVSIWSPAVVGPLPIEGMEPNPTANATTRRSA